MPPPIKPLTRARVLIVEDSSVFREMQALLLRQAGFGVWSFEDPASALAEAETQTFELALVDFQLPGMNGGEFMNALHRLQPAVPVIIVSGSLTLELVAELTRQGAAGIFRKPTNPRVLLEKIHEILNHSASASELRAGTNLNTGASHIPFPLPEPAADQLAYEPRYVFGASDAFRAFTHHLWRTRDFRSVLLMQGEPGSPFELFARELVGLSIFRNGPVMICEAEEFEARRLTDILAPALLTSQAGTLLVQNVDELSAPQQRLLDELISLRGMFQPFSRRLRIIVTSTTQLSSWVEARRFDETLYYKLSAISLAVPSLAEMRNDIVANATRLLHQQSEVDARAPLALTPEATTWLESQSWPRNYAQLAHTLLFSLRHARGGTLDVDALEAGAQEYENDRLARSGKKLLPGASIDAVAPAEPTLERDGSTPLTKSA